MKIRNTNICLTSRKSIMVIFILLFSTIGLAKILKPLPKIKKSTEEPWKPTKEDIAFQDSMYCIIERTQLDLDTIRAGIDKILYKLERLEYSDGTYDSIRYVVGSKIDKRRNK